MSELSIVIPCVLNHLYPQIVEKSVKVFSKLGYSINIEENQGCCGYPFLINGEKEETKELAQKLLFDFQTGKRNHKITTLSSQCSHTINKSYPTLFRNSISHNLCQKVLADVVDVFDILNSHEIVIQPKEKQVLVIDNLISLSVLKDITNYDSSDSNWLVKDNGYSCSGVGSGLNKFNNKEAKASMYEYFDFAKNNKVDILTFTDEFSLAFADSLIKNENLPLKTQHLFDVLYAQLH